MRGFKSLLWGAGLFCGVQCGTASAATVQIIDPPGGGCGDISIVGIDDLGRVYGNGPTCAAFVRAPDGNFTEIRVPGAPSTAVNLVASNGDVAGTYGIDRHHFGYYVRKANGTISTFSLDNAAVELLGIDAKAGVFGRYYSGVPGDKASYGFVRANDGTISIFAMPDGTYAYSVSGISRAGAVAGGICKIWNLCEYGFIRDQAGVITKFEVPSSRISSLRIDRRGGVAGWTHQDGDTHGLGFFRDLTGAIMPFDVSCPYWVQIDAVNSHRTVAGSCMDNQGYLQVFSRPAKGTDTVFDFPDKSFVKSIHVTGVSKTGVVVGSYNGLGGYHGFIATP